MMELISAHHTNTSRLSFFRNELKRQIFPIGLHLGERIFSTSRILGRNFPGGYFETKKDCFPHRVATHRFE